MLRIILATLWLAIGLGAACCAAELPSQHAVDYVRDVKPIFATRCHLCHGALKQESSLRLDVASTIRAGGDSGPAIEPGDSSQSLLIRAVRGDDGWRMPPEGPPLSDAEISTLVQWVDSGAIAPDEPIPPDPRKHWAFTPPRRPSAPAGAPASANPIDAFLAETHREQRLVAVGEADRQVLLRRVYLDLVGVPPSREDLAAFSADDSHDAYEKVVDSLLASAHYGERWGRHWMDVWRYSDWAGFKHEIRDSHPHIWRWRDWIVESLNADKPYDQMVVEMLAGDEVAPTDPDVLRATGFLVRNYYKHNRNVWLERAVEHTSKAFLAMTVNCARCHDHMYDPIAQTDFYRFRALFEPYDVRIDLVGKVLDPKVDGLVRVVDRRVDDMTRLFIRGDERSPDPQTQIVPGVPGILGELASIEPVALPVEAYYPGVTARAQAMVVHEAGRVLRVRIKTLADAKAKTASANADNSDVDSAKANRANAAALRLAELVADEAESSLSLAKAAIAADRARYADPPADDADRLIRRAARRQYDYNLAKARTALETNEQALDNLATAAETDVRLVVARKAAADAQAQLDALMKIDRSGATAYDPIVPVEPSTSTGRRLALARWITSRDNPLAARVAVNHIWLRHFGAALVPTVFDFGNNGASPWQPELLDWLAVELMDHGWSMKHLHRLIVTSRAYRRDSSATLRENLERDPDNVYLWRMNARRMEAETVRDSVLAVTGGLDAAMGGADIDHALGLTNPRRSMYFRSAREKQMEFMTLFDAANPNECYRRSESIVPQQALALANSALSLRRARCLARQIDAEIEGLGSSGDARTFVGLAFEYVLARSASTTEVDACEQFLANQTELFRRAEAPIVAPDKEHADGAAPANDPALRARENLVHVLLNHHDFVTVR